MKLNDKQKIVLTAGAFLAVALGIGFLTYQKVNQRKELVLKMNACLQEEAAANAKLAQIPGLRDQRAKLANIIDQYAEILPKEGEVQHDTFVDTIDGYRRDTKVVIQRAEYIRSKGGKDAASANESFVRHRYRFKLLGTVQDFMEFVNKIENHTRFLKVDAISIRPVGSPAEESGDDLSDRVDEEELGRAAEPIKDIELTVSTYTYSRGREQRK